MKEKEVIEASLAKLDDISERFRGIADLWDSSEMPDSWFADNRVTDISMMMNMLYMDILNLKRSITEL